MHHSRVNSESESKKYLKYIQLKIIVLQHQRISNSFDILWLSLLPAKQSRMHSHYEKTPMQYTVIFTDVKKNNFQMKNCDIFLNFAVNIDRGYTLEPHQRGGSNKYTQSMF